MIAAILPTIIVRLQSQTAFKVIESSIIKGVISVPLLQSLFGIESLSHSFNGVCWFMSTLFLLYCIAPWLVNKVRRVKRTWDSLFALILFAGVVYFLFRSIENHTAFDDLSYGSPYYRIINILIGMAIAKLYSEGRIKKNNILTNVVFIVSAGWFVCRYRVVHNKPLFMGSTYRSFDMFLCALLIVTIISSDGAMSRFFASKYMVRLGRISSSFFLIHYVVRMYIGLILGNGEISVMTGFVAAILIAAVSFGVSVAWDRRKMIVKKF